MTRAELLAVVYHFYPRAIEVTGLGYHDTEERQRQRDAMQRGVAAFPTWKAMLGRLRARYALMDHSEYLLAGVWDSAYSASLEIPGRTLGFHVSLLGSYYGIHRTGAAGEEPAALDLAREIEATFPGYVPIPPELGDEVVPDVALYVKPFGRATIFDLLLSDGWDGSSEPWPPPVNRSAEEEAALEAAHARQQARLRADLPVAHAVFDSDDDDPDRKAEEPLSEDAPRRSR
jgi:hypothetical protein